MAIKYLKLIENLKTNFDLIQSNKIQKPCVSTAVLGSAVLAIVIKKYERRHIYCYREWTSGHSYIWYRPSKDWGEIMNTCQ